MFRSKPLYDNWDLGGGTDIFVGLTKPNTRDIFIPLDSGNNDIDANSFIRGAGITDEFQKIVIQELVKNLKMYNLWDKLLVCYPIIGGTAVRHGMNLKDYTTFNASFTNSPTHNANGITFNGSNQYCNTLFNPASLSLNIQQWGFGQSIYWKNTGANSGSHGCDAGLPEYFLINTVNNIVRVFNTSANADNAGIPNPPSTSGFTLSSRIGNTVFAMLNKHINSRTIAYGSTTNRVCYFGARNSSGSPADYGSGTARWYAIHTGLTTNQALSLNKIVEQYNQRLNRMIIY